MLTFEFASLTYVSVTTVTDVTRAATVEIATFLTGKSPQPQEILVMRTLRLAEMTAESRDALTTYIEREASCHAHDEAMTWDDLVETADSCIPDDWDGCEIETDDEDFQELRGWAQGLIMDYVDVIDVGRQSNA